MNLSEAMSKPLSDFDNVNVKIWAIPHYEGSQTRFNLDCESAIALDPPSADFKEVEALFHVEARKSKGMTDQEILDQIHSWYRIPVPIQNPFY